MYAPRVDADDPRGALVYAEATRSLDQQEALLENIQARAGTLLSAASIATSFFAALAIRRHHGLTLLTGCATGASIAMVAICVTLLAPRGRWAFRFEVGLLVKNCLDADPPPPPPLAQIHHDLSEQMDGWIRRNEKKLERMLWWFRWAAIALGSEVAFWIADLITRR